jgi:hypothetical protein
MTRKGGTGMTGGGYLDDTLLGYLGDKKRIYLHDTTFASIFAN